MLTFSPIESFTGGILLFLSSSSFVALNGEVFGISGIIENAFHATGSKRQTAWSVLMGLGLGGYLMKLTFLSTDVSYDKYQMLGPISSWIIGGLLLGLGSKVSFFCF